MKDKIYYTLVLILVLSVFISIMTYIKHAIDINYQAVELIRKTQFEQLHEDIKLCNLQK